MVSGSGCRPCDGNCGRRVDFVGDREVGPRPPLAVVGLHRQRVHASAVDALKIGLPELCRGDDDGNAIRLGCSVHDPVAFPRFMIAAGRAVVPERVLRDRVVLRIICGEERGRGEGLVVLAGGDMRALRRHYRRQVGGGEAYPTAPRIAVICLRIQRVGLRTTLVNCQVELRRG
jgi:hypothetical protein